MFNLNFILLFGRKGKGKMVRLRKTKQGFMLCDEVNPYHKSTYAPSAPFGIRGSAPLQGGGATDSTQGPEEAAEVQFQWHNVGRPLQLDV